MGYRCNQQACQSRILLHSILAEVACDLLSYVSEVANATRRRLNTFSRGNLHSSGIRIFANFIFSIHDFFTKKLTHVQQNFKNKIHDGELLQVNEEVTSGFLAAAEI